MPRSVEDKPLTSAVCVFAALDELARLYRSPSVWMVGQRSGIRQLDTANDRKRLRSFFGLLVFVFIAVIFSNSDATIGAQLYGIFAIGAFTIIASTLVWYVIKFTIGIRVTEEEELEGVDLAEIGMEAYPDFKK